MAITYRRSRRRGTSAMAPASDILRPMSAFVLISSGLPPILLQNYLAGVEMQEYNRNYGYSDPFLLISVWR